MRNPFNIEKQPKEFSIFEQLTENIDRWMLEKYPEFDTRLNSKIKRLEEVEVAIHALFKIQNDSVGELKEENLQWFKAEMKKFMETEYPDVSGKLFVMAEQLKKDVKSITELDKKIKKKLDEKISEVDKHLTNTKIYNSLCEDVYRLRDKMEVLQDEVSVFTKKLKKAFE